MQAVITSSPNTGSRYKPGSMDAPHHQPLFNFRKLGRKEVFGGSSVRFDHRDNNAAGEVDAVAIVREVVASVAESFDQLYNRAVSAQSGGGRSGGGSQKTKKAKLTSGMYVCYAILAAAAAAVSP